MENETVAMMLRCYIIIVAAKSTGSLYLINRDLCIASVILLKPKMEKQSFECLSSFHRASHSIRLISTALLFCVCSVCYFFVKI